MCPVFTGNDAANVASRNSISFSQFSLKDITSCIFAPDGTNNIGSQPTLAVTTATIVQWILKKMISSMTAKRANLKVLHAIVGTHAILVMGGEAIIGWIKKRERDNTMRQSGYVLAILAENASRIANITRSFAQYATVQCTTIYTGSVQTSDATQIAGFIDTFVSRNGFPDFFRHTNLLRLSV